LTDSAPRILLLDIETAPSLGWVWSLYETNVLKTVQDWYILSFACKWLDKLDISSWYLPDFRGYNPKKPNDFLLCRVLWRYFDEADVIVAHNGDQFDLTKSNARFITHGFKPPRPYKTIDTLKIARKHFSFSSNKLDDLGQYLGLGAKLPTGGFGLWEACMKGDLKAWEKMREYNIQDVRLLEQVYLKLRPWATGHPNLSAYSGDHVCPTCSSSKIQRRGFTVARVQVRQRFHCQSCGSWFSGKIIKRG
jgi:hypothetical protein